MRKKVQSMCLKEFKHRLDLNKIELHSRNEALYHQTRKNEMELDFIARKNDQELEFKRKLQALDILNHEQDERVKPKKNSKAMRAGSKC